jgi:hypothetical protein
MDWLPINWAIIKHPINWAIVFLMVFIAMIALNYLLAPWHSPQAATLGANSQPGPDLSFTQ